MRHHQYNPDFVFYKKPIDFNKYAERDLLRYCLGATMYMPGTKNFAFAITEKRYPGLTSMVMCFEDACPENEVEAAEANSIVLLDILLEKLADGSFSYDDLPLIFFRVRNIEQFKHFSNQLHPEHIKLITGFNFPKFNSKNGKQYLAHLKELNLRFDEIIYGMPILEDRSIAYQETRIPELLRIKDILDQYKELVLNVRVGVTDFSSIFGMRRGINSTIYDVMTVRDCLTAILNIFIRENDYVVSGPVWEYFRASKEMRFKPLPKFNFEETLIQRTPIINDAVDGLMREVLLDRANGFIGKTIIHPTHLNYVNGLLAVTEEEYLDATQILESTEAVIKSASKNKMNEIAPHKNWAQRIVVRAQVYGVVANESSYIDLIHVG